MQRFSIAILLSALSFTAIGQQAAGQETAGADHAEKAWIKQSNVYTNMLLSVQLEHSPEQGSTQGVAAYDERISDPSLADQAAERRELEAALTKIKAARATVKDKNVRDGSWPQLELRRRHREPFQEVQLGRLGACVR
jgi:hypothetical protein